MVKATIAYVLRIAITVIRPFFGVSGTCRYTVSCTAYASYVLEHKPLIPALWLIIKRVISCR